MKKILFSGLMVFLIISACKKEESKYPQGAWQLIQTQSIKNGRVEVTYPGILIGSEFKIWSEKNFMFVGRWKEDTLITDNYGYGTYTLEGNQYEETVLYHFSKDYEGQKIKMKLELRNDTLIQIYHRFDSTGKQSEDITSVEKYVHIK